MPYFKLFEQFVNEADLGKLSNFTFRDLIDPKFANDIIEIVSSRSPVDALVMLKTLQKKFPSLTKEDQWEDEIKAGVLSAIDLSNVDKDMVEDAYLRTMSPEEKRQYIKELRDEVKNKREHLETFKSNNTARHRVIEDSIELEIKNLEKAIKIFNEIHPKVETYTKYEL